MENRSLSAGGIVIGGMLLAAWLYFFIPNTPGIAPDVTTTGWALWGLLGLAVTGGLFFVRKAGVAGQMVGWMVLGIGIGIVVMATFVSQRWEGLAAVFTLMGGGLIANALNTPSNELPPRAKA